MLQKNFEIITAATTQPPYVYDPRVRRASTVEQYAALMTEADKKSVPLYVNNDFLQLSKLISPVWFAMLADSAVV